MTWHIYRYLATVNHPTDSGGIGISLNQTAGFEPSDKGIFVYLRPECESLGKVIDAGGKIVQGKGPAYTVIVSLAGRKTKDRLLECRGSLEIMYRNLDPDCQHADFPRPPLKRLFRANGNRDRRQCQPLFGVCASTG
jgi:hypothetical protein